MKEIINKTHIEIACDTVQEFLQHLSNFASRGRPMRTDGWMWRGVGDSERHTLVPSALRPENWKAQVAVRNLDALPQAGWSYDHPKSPIDQATIELANLSMFYRYANDQALPLPPQPQPDHFALIRRLDDAMFDLDFSELTAWPRPSLWPILALAQHYGVMTRLLDWSKDFYIAAYFAARAAFFNRAPVENESSRLAVWGVSPTIITATQSISPPRTKSLSDPRCRIYVVDAPYAGNPNLAAQGGRFTLTTVDDHHPDLETTSPLDEILRYIQQKNPNNGISELLVGKHDTPSAIKFSLPTSHSKELLKTLHKIGYDASRLFPGFTGCVEAIREATAIMFQ